MPGIDANAIREKVLNAGLSPGDIHTYSAGFDARDVPIFAWLLGGIPVQMAFAESSDPNCPAPPKITIFDHSVIDKQDLKKPGRRGGGGPGNSDAPSGPRRYSPKIVEKPCGSGNDFVPNAFADGKFSVPWEVKWEREHWELQNDTLLFFEDTWWGIEKLTGEQLIAGFGIGGGGALAISVAVLLAAGGPPGWAVIAAIGVSAVIAGLMTALDLAEDGHFVPEKLLWNYALSAIPVAGAFARVAGRVAPRVSAFLRRGIFNGHADILVNDAGLVVKSKTWEATRRITERFAAHVDDFNAARGKGGLFKQAVDKPKIQRPVPTTLTSAQAHKIATMSLKDVAAGMKEGVRKLSRAKAVIDKQLNRLDVPARLFGKRLIEEPRPFQTYAPTTRVTALKRFGTELVWNSTIYGTISGANDAIAVSLDPEIATDMRNPTDAFIQGWARGAALSFAAFGGGAAVRVLFKRGLPTPEQALGMMNTLTISIRRSAIASVGTLATLGILTDNTGETAGQELTLGRFAKQLNLWGRMWMPGMEFTEEERGKHNWVFRPVNIPVFGDVSIGNLSQFAGLFTFPVSGLLRSFGNKPGFGFAADAMKKLHAGAKISYAQHIAVFEGIPTPALNVTLNSARMAYLKQLGNMALLHISLTGMGIGFGTQYQNIKNPFYLDMGRFIFGHFGGTYFDLPNGDVVWKPHSVQELIGSTVHSTLLYGTVFFSTMGVMLPAVESLPLRLGWFVKNLENVATPAAGKIPSIYRQKVEMLGKPVWGLAEESLVENTTDKPLYVLIYAISGGNHNLAFQLSQQIAETIGLGGRVGNVAIEQQVATNVGVLAQHVFAGITTINRINVSADSYFFENELTHPEMIKRLEELAEKSPHALVELGSGIGHNVDPNSPDAIKEIVGIDDLIDHLKAIKTWGKLVDDVVIDAGPGIPQEFVGKRLSDFSEDEIKALNKSDRAAITAILGQVHTEVERLVTTNLQQYQLQGQFAGLNLVNNSALAPLLGQLGLPVPHATPLDFFGFHPSRNADGEAQGVAPTQGTGPGSPTGPGAPEETPLATFVGNPLLKDLQGIAQNLAAGTGTRTSAKLAPNAPVLTAEAVQSVQQVISDNIEAGKVTSLVNAPKLLEAFKIAESRMSAAEWADYKKKLEAIAWHTVDLGENVPALDANGDVYSIRGPPTDIKTPIGTTIRSNYNMYLTKAAFDTLSVNGFLQLMDNEVGHVPGLNFVHKNARLRRLNAAATQGQGLADLNSEIMDMQAKSNTPAAWNRLRTLASFVDHNDPGGIFRKKAIELIRANPSTSAPGGVPFAAGTLPTWDVAAGDINAEIDIGADATAPFKGAAATFGDGNLLDASAQIAAAQFATDAKFHINWGGAADPFISPEAVFTPNPEDETNTDYWSKKSALLRMALKTGNAVSYRHHDQTPDPFPGFSIESIDAEEEFLSYQTKLVANDSLREAIAALRTTDAGLVRFLMDHSVKIHPVPNEGTDAPIVADTITIQADNASQLKAQAEMLREYADYRNGVPSIGAPAPDFATYLKNRQLAAADFHIATTKLPRC